MKILNVKGISGNSNIIVNGSISQVGDYLPEGKLVIITDETVKSLYEESFPGLDIISIGSGEGIKTLQTVEEIYQRLLELEVDRSGFILGIGGGIVCDITGFVASTYMRGLRFGFVASTLMAQVDASVGGKNGVNYSGYKNMIGVFNQPDFVICDIKMLHTLPEKELTNGFAEIVKHALIGDRALFTFLEKNYQDALNLDTKILERLIYDSLVLKSRIVNRDEKEKGERRKLNFGHTMAHAIEKTMGLTHGEAVAAGIGIASRLSVQLSGLAQMEEERLIELLNRLNLSRKIEFPCADLKEAIRRDKKREGDLIHFILLKQIGKAIIREISIQRLEEVIDDLC